MRYFPLIGLIVSAGVQGIAPPAAFARPLSLETVADTAAVESRSMIALTPDGIRAAMVYQRPLDSSSSTLGRSYSDTGVPLTEGKGRRHLLLVNTRDGRSVEPLASDATGHSAWGASWSPDGRRLAFYSDADGSAGLWFYGLKDQSRRRIGSAVARPFFASDLPEWIDNDHILLKVLPAGMTIGRANALDPKCDRACPIAAEQVGHSRPSVVVLRAGLGKAGAEPSPISPRPDTLTSAADLVIADTRTGDERVLVSNSVIRGYQISPDRSKIAFTVLLGEQRNTQQLAFSVHVYDLVRSADRIVGSTVFLRYGDEVIWSPDSRSFAFTSRNADRSRAMIVVDANAIGQDAMRTVVPALDGLGPDRPVWSSDAGALYAIGAGRLYSIDPRSGAMRAITAASPWRILRIMGLRGGRVVAFASNDGASGSTLVGIDPSNGRVTSFWSLANSHVEVGTATLSRDGGVIFAAEDIDHPGDLWFAGGPSSAMRRLTHLNPGFDAYATQPAVAITWQTSAGKPLRGALMLPPGYRAGDRLPTVFFVYGGALIRDRADRYGAGWGDDPAFDMHVLTTRGYAVFFPDMPVRVGATIDDFMASIQSGADALVKQGYADPDRLAIMGQSFGAYTVWSILTRTDRFKAAVTTGNVLHPDLVAAYLAMNPDGTTPAGYFEDGQGNMGGSLWRFPDRYRSNSPVWKLDAVKAPLLMGQGDEDGDLKAPDAMFVGLQRLNKPVEYRLYRGEDHVIGFRPNVIDWWTRRLQFLDQYIGSPATDRP